MIKAIWLVLVAGVLLGLWFAFGRALTAGRRKKREVQKLLALAAAEGTLTPQMIQAALGYSKEKADKALAGLRKEGLAEFDVDGTGSPVYRVDPKAIEARKGRGW
jgi:hypothetical protein